LTNLVLEITLLCTQLGLFGLEVFRRAIPLAVSTELLEFGPQAHDVALRVRKPEEQGNVALDVLDLTQAALEIGRLLDQSRVCLLERAAPALQFVQILRRHAALPVCAASHVAVDRLDRLEDLAQVVLELRDVPLDIASGLLAAGFRVLSLGRLGRDFLLHLLQRHLGHLR